jgi:hypothetical protein
MPGTKPATTKTSAPTAKPAAPCSCGCQGGANGACTCGQAICFERPNYFAGQLLNDTDLSAGQSYLREKLKLYHRTLHGHGVVCGLRLMCDPNCCGHIRIGEGFAIDNCGNDIVVCETASFNVIAALKAKNYLITDPPPDPCDEEKEPRCKVKQCFYVVICYDEQQANFITPFQSQCGPGTTPCQPTRIRETYHFDILDHPPHDHDYLHELEKRITCCWKIFTEGPLAKFLQKHFNKDWTPQAAKDYHQIFCQLKVLFRQHLQRCPDKYDCTLEDQLCQLHCPHEEGRDWERYRECFCKLFELMLRYVYDCILGDFIFPCPHPSKARCVGLGKIEVEDGRILHVCNCPRTYVWSFAHFFEVLLATILGGAACTSHDRKPTDEEGRHETERHKEVCCTRFVIDCEQFLELFRQRPDFGRLATAAPVHTIRRVMEALRKSFNFTDPLAFSPRIFEGLSSEDAQALANKLAGDNRGAFQEFVDPKHHEALDPVAAILAYLLRRPGDDLAVAVASRAEEKQFVAAVLPTSQTVGQSLEPAGLSERLQAAETKAAAAQTAADNLTRQLQDREQELNNLKAQVAAIQDQLRQPPPPAPPA